MGVVFAFPAELADPWILGAESAGSRVVCASSETAAGYMANGLAQVTGAPAVVIVGGGPALAMLVPAIQCAGAEGLPVLTMVGQSDGTAFPETGELGTRDAELLRAVFADAVIDAPDFSAVAAALDSADRFLALRRPVAVTIPVPRTSLAGALDGRCEPIADGRSPARAVERRRGTGVVRYNDVLRAAAVAAGDEYPLFVDAGQARQAARAALPVGSFFDASRTAPMGAGLCGAIGTAIAQRRRTYAVVGDGSALMFLAELATAARHRAPVTIVVCVNGVLGGPHARTSRHGSPSSVLGHVDWLGISAAFGIPCTEAGDRGQLVRELRVTGDGPRLVFVPTPKFDDVTGPADG